MAAATSVKFTAELFFSFAKFQFYLICSIFFIQIVNFEKQLD